MNKNIIMFLLLCLMGCNKNEPRPDDSGLFIKFFGSAFNDAGYAVIEDGSGGFYIAGSVSNTSGNKNVYVVHTDKNGNKLWTQEYGGAKDDEAHDIMLHNGGLLVAGYTTAANDSTQAWLLELALDGQQTGSHTYGLSTRNEKIHHIMLTADNQILLSGTRQYQHDTLINVYMVKTNIASTTWEKEIGLARKFDELGSVEETTNGDILFCGTVKRDGETDLRLVRATAEGSLKWDFSFGEGNGIFENGKDMVMLNDGSVVMCGYQGNIKGNHNALLVKADANGNQVWMNESLGGGMALNSIKAFDGGFIAAGSMPGANQDTDYLLMKLSNEGNSEWSKSFGGRGLDNAAQVLPTTDGGILMVGSVYSFNNFLIGMIKTDAEGNVNKKK